MDLANIRCRGVGCSRFNTKEVVSEHHPPPERPYPLDHEGRIARLEGIVEQIDVRLGRIETKIDATRAELDGKIDANREALETKIDRLYRWVVPLQITTILAIVGLAFKAFSG